MGLFGAHRGAAQGGRSCFRAFRCAQEPRPHQVLFDGVGLRTILDRVESPRATAVTLPAKRGGDTIFPPPWRHRRLDRAYRWIPFGVRKVGLIVASREAIEVSVPVGPLPVWVLNWFCP